MSYQSVNYLWLILVGLLGCKFTESRQFGERERERDHERGGAEGQADIPLGRELDLGLNPRTLGS